MIHVMESIRILKKRTDAWTKAALTRFYYSPFTYFLIFLFIILHKGAFDEPIAIYYFVVTHSFCHLISLTFSLDDGSVPMHGKVLS